MKILIVFVSALLLESSQSYVMNSVFFCSRIGELQETLQSMLESLSEKPLLISYMFPRDCQVFPSKFLSSMVIPHEDDRMDRHTFTSSLTRKYSGFVTLILSPASEYSDVHSVYHQFFFMALSENSIFVFIIVDSKWSSGKIFKAHSTVCNLPALKFAIYFDTAFHIRILENNNRNSDNWQILRTPDQLGLPLPHLLHKTLFWDRMGRVIIHGNFWERPPKSLYSCPEVLRKRSLELRYCSYKRFSLSVLSEVHNLTVLDDDLEPRGMDSAEDLIRRGSVAFPVNRWFRNGLELSDVDSFSFLYCVPATTSDGKAVHVSFWIHPFKAEVWYLLGLLFIVYCFAKTNSGLFQCPIAALLWSLCKILAVMVGQGSTHKYGVNLCIAFLGFLVGTLYGNCLLSYVVKPEESLSYNYLTELIRDGYKILGSPFGEVVNSVIYKDLKIRGIENEKVWDKYKSIIPTRKFEFDPSKLTERRIIFQYSSIGNIRLNHYYQSSVDRSTTLKYNCKILTERIHVFPNFWVVRSAGRIWIRSTLARIREAGLQGIWNRWVQDADVGWNGRKLLHTVIPCDIIMLRKFRLLLDILLTTGFCCAFIVFACEKIFRVRRREPSPQ